MAIANFVPDIWSAELMVALEKSLVYAAPGVVNRDFEGQISAAGDSVRITSLAEPTIGTYTAHTDITVEDVDDTTQSLLIDQAKYFAFEVDDIEARQARGGIMDEQARKAAYKLRDVADQLVATTMSTGRDAGNQIAELTVSTASAAYDLLVDLSVILDVDNVPSEGRFAIVTPAFHGKLLKDSRFVGTGSSQSDSVRANGVVGEAAGFRIAKSNNSPAGPGAGAGTQILAGHPMAMTYAEQISSVEATRMEKRFGSMVKGLHLYGMKVVRPTALAAADVIVT
jgi:hypothetical protein